MVGGQRAAERRQPGGAGARGAGVGGMAGYGGGGAAGCTVGGWRGRAWTFYFHGAQLGSIFERSRRYTAQRAGGGFDRVSGGLGQAGAAHGAARPDSDRGGGRFDGADGRGLGPDPGQSGGAAIPAGRNLPAAA